MPPRDAWAPTMTELASVHSPHDHHNSKQSTTSLKHVTEQGFISSLFEWIEWKKWEERIPFLQKIAFQLRRIPPAWRTAFIIVWILWKVTLVIFFVRVLQLSHADNSSSKNKGRVTPMVSEQHHQQQAQFHDSGASGDAKRTKVLYIVTSLAEYDSGMRATIKGRDRFQELMVPCIVDSIQSMLGHPYDFDVDFYLITAYELKPERRDYLKDRLPPGVGMQIWDDACPLGYDKRNSKENIDVTRALARQHRYVIKDKLHHYDIFLPFEDDMRIHGAHVQHYLDMTAEIERLTLEAPETLPDLPESEDPTKMKFFGSMTRDQMKRLIPGFIRVEVLINEEEHGAQTKLAPIELDFNFKNYLNGKYQPPLSDVEIDPSFCCHVPNMQPNYGIPVRPHSSDIIIWETRAEALGLRHIADSKMFEWVVLLPGPGKRENPKEKVFGYWSGRNNEFGQIKKKPSGGVPDLIAQQGGWMATRDQLIRLDEELCAANFLPPFNEPTYYEDGQQSMNVEFWSGGYQYFTGVRGGCNMQRIVSFASPEEFSKHLIYHMANNKQKQLNQDRMLRAQNLFGQMNTILKKAQKDMYAIVKSKRK
eukprot:CAMPEP_0178910678 /NCGR_PEP_ID=MMETSP0786-20121207/9229_1 /TAXON_ID=186022 /ORGANISM="Thalassionema frauenfeldii, Strain CCMP 1798" /LENGTH=590 /DNA_ID=CAMNT_0020582953 /DNA_START=1 /DNA_END=1771 /DNA_ORIENTATION=-